jgi:sigma-B regulation protein RsbU (phosphoserine phosphatase)
MSLRLRLIVAFFALSVVPLGAVTFYTYRTSVDAFRDAAEREADLLAGELSQRMQLVTSQLSERVEHLMDIAELQAAVEAVERPAAASTDTTASATAAASAVETVSNQVAQSLGEAAMLLNNVELLGLRPSSQRGSGSRQGASRAGSTPPSAPPPPGVTAATPPPSQGRSGRTRPAPKPTAGSIPSPPATPVVSGTPPPAPVPAASDTSMGRMLVDLIPVRRELYREIMGEARPETLTPEQRQKVADEINQRMLGIAQGIRLGAAELQKKAALALQAEAQAKAAKAAEPAASTASKKPSPPATTPRDQRKSTISGNKLDVKVERDGKVVRQVNAEINLPNVLATVFTTTRRDGGEVPFAVGQDGRIYTRSDDDRVKVEALGPVATPAGPATVRLPDWIAVTTPDPSGSGLRLGIARPTGDSVASLRRAAARNVGFGLLFIGVALAGIVPLASRLTRNLSVLGDAVHRIAEGDYAARVPVKAKDEVGRLAVAFNQMAEDVEKHQKAAVGQERIRRELELGRQIQNEMLPHAPLRLGLTEIKGVSVPAREVGGDFFNYFEIEHGPAGVPREVALLVGDVSGKGVGAALLMANIQASLRTRLALGQDLSALADEIDRDIEANSPGPLYATLFVGILNPVSRRLRYVNAGHHPQYVLRVNGALERMESTGLPIGLLAGRGHREQSVQLAAGDLLFFYTDGCVEAESESDDMFGPERLEALLLSHAVDGAGDLLERIESGIGTFRGRREPFDDATMMAVKIG